MSLGHLYVFFAEMSINVFCAFLIVFCFLFFNIELYDIDGKLLSVGFGNDVWTLTLKAKATKAKNKYNYSKLKQRNPSTK